MGKTISKALETVRQYTIEDTQNAQMVRFSLVYILLFLLMLCGSSGVFGATKLETARVSLEKFELKPVTSETALFNNYYYDSKIFKGSLEKGVQELQALTAARQDFIEKATLQERAELGKLKEEHRNLMLNSANAQNDVKDKGLKDYTDWSVALYSNITQQALLKQTSQGKIANWDAKNFIKVQAIEKNGKKYLVSLQVHRINDKAKSAVASIR